jgi:hypothetical protein
MKFKVGRSVQADAASSELVDLFERRLEFRQARRLFEILSTTRKTFEYGRSGPDPMEICKLDGCVPVSPIRWNARYP